MRLHNNHSNARTKTSTVTPKFVLIFFFLSDFLPLSNRWFNWTSHHSPKCGRVCVLRCDRPTNRPTLSIFKWIDERLKMKEKFSLPLGVYHFFSLSWSWSRRVAHCLLVPLVEYFQVYHANQTEPSIYSSVRRPSVYLWMFVAVWRCVALVVRCACNTEKFVFKVFVLTLDSQTDFTWQRDARLQEKNETRKTKKKEIQRKTCFIRCGVAPERKRRWRRQ